jgi:NADPH2:quinone reductase
MKAIVFEQTGKAEEVLRVRELAPPVAGAEELLIRVSARPIHPADLLFIAGRYRVQPTFPQVAGFDGVGTVAGLGAKVSDFAVGERVAFRSPGAWAELAVAPVTRVYRVPDGVPDEVACQFPLNPLTAWGLLDECRLPPGSRLLITAGRSVVAGLLTALALRRGIDPYLLVREASDYRVLAADGRRILARGAEVKEALQELEGTTFQAVVDAVGGPASLALIDAIEPGGRLITYGLLDDTPFTLQSSTLLFKILRWQGFGVDAWLGRSPPEQLAVACAELWAVLGETPELLPVVATFDLDRIQEAIAALYTHHPPGKILLRG